MDSSSVRVTNGTASVFEDTDVRMGARAAKTNYETNPNTFIQQVGYLHSDGRSSRVLLASRVKISVHATMVQVKSQ